ncbi:hypothetical protein BJ742DRAFT_810065 [Cladochytrium replicatum]|nr:hypothetical protein BJ742DRAFT_810065 [Cladochytrium replicatum]
MYQQDYADCSIKALDWVADHLAQNNDEIILVHAVPEDLPLVDVEYGELSVVSSENSLRERAFQQAEKNLSEWAQSFVDAMKKKKINVDIKTEVDYGSAGPLIVSKCEKYDPTLVVVGSHGKSTISGLLMGSVSSYCLHHAQRPVLVVNQTCAH